jgi:hypothetical protein
MHQVLPESVIDEESKVMDAFVCLNCHHVPIHESVVGMYDGKPPPNLRLVQELHDGGAIVVMMPV